MFQKCPICEGTGVSSTFFETVCSVCKGFKIIDEKTGKPPEYTNLPVEDTGKIPEDIKEFLRKRLTEKLDGIKILKNYNPRKFLAFPEEGLWWKEQLYNEKFENI